MIDVWAPAADTVDIVLHAGARPVEQRREPMVPTGDGWWSWTDEHAAYQPLDYAFSLGGGTPFPDPRSSWQPTSVDGPSRWFDPGSHDWQDADWRGTRDGEGVLGSVIYELHVGTFTRAGTLDAAIGRLDHLVGLGVDIVEVMPVAAFPGRWGWGYDGVALYAVHAQYGGPAALQRFVDACHDAGLGVCLDVVYNHLGPSGNYLGQFGPYFTDAHQTPWGSAVNFDAPGSEVVRRFIIDNALRWFTDFHIDALRLDAVHELRDDSERHILQQLSDEVAALATRLGRPLDLIAESDLNDTDMVAPTAEGGRGMTAQWDDDVHHALHVLVTGEDQGYYSDFTGDGDVAVGGGVLDVVAKTLTRGFLHDGVWSSFRDQEWGAPVDRRNLDARRLLGYLQNHDQVGNRATGERISALTTPSDQALGAAIYLLSAFTPMIFMGEEWGATTPFLFFTDFDDLELGEAITEGRRSEFGAHGWSEEEVPDPQDRSARDRSVLRWDEVDRPEHAQMLSWYSALTALRHGRFGDEESHLVDVDVTVHEDDQWLVMRHGGLTVAANLADAAQVVPLRTGTTLVLVWDPRETAKVAGGIHLPAHSVAVLR